MHVSATRVHGHPGSQGPPACLGHGPLEAEIFGTEKKSKLNESTAGHRAFLKLESESEHRGRTWRGPGIPRCGHGGCALALRSASESMSLITLYASTSTSNGHGTSNGQDPGQLSQQRSHWPAGGRAGWWQPSMDYSSILMYIRALPTDFATTSYPVGVAFSKLELALLISERCPACMHSKRCQWCEQPRGYYNFMLTATWLLIQYAHTIL